MKAQIGTNVICRITWIIAITVNSWATVMMGADSSETEAKKTLAVMTFNLRFASPTGPHSWPERRPIMSACIQQAAPDVIGTQEGVYNQLKDMAADLPEYEWIGLGRNGGSHGEFMAVFYRKERLEPLEFDHFWLSDTPMVIDSTTWGNSNRRMVTWIRFGDRATGKQFYFFNTHFDHLIQPAREKSAVLVRHRIDELETKLPVLLVGDFNAGAGKNPAYDILVKDGGFTDLYLQAEKKGPDTGTFHNYQGPKPGGIRIDWLLARGPVQAHSADVITFSQSGEYPSDHFPVLVRVELLN